jgi:uncharacterized membrane protein
MEAFSDGVIAIIVTIMVLELHPPSEPTVEAVLKVAPSLLSYALSFLVVSIMWVNHHHMVHTVREVSARLLWSNLYLLFWMSLVPLVTEYLGKNPRVPLAVALYGLDLVMCASGFWLLRLEMIRQHRHDEAMSAHHASVQRKNAFSAALYLLSVPLAYFSVYASFFIFILIPAIYFLPERVQAESDRR